MPCWGRAEGLSPIRLQLRREGQAGLNSRSAHRARTCATTAETHSPHFSSASRSARSRRKSGPEVQNQIEQTQGRRGIVKRQNERLLNCDRAIERSGVSPIFKEVRFGYLPLALHRSLVGVQADVKCGLSPCEGGSGNRNPAARCTPGCHPESAARRRSRHPYR